MTTAQILVLGIGTTGRKSARRRRGREGAAPDRLSVELAGAAGAVHVAAGASRGAHDRWILVYVVTSQGRVAVVLRVAFSHDGVSTYTYADLLFQMPYGVLAVSLLDGPHAEDRPRRGGR
ncbi:hypothetical protein GS454_05355 [Rhodococcus hoagii]|nr:hypothetical protein [Prescottella equi]